MNRNYNVDPSAKAAVRLVYIDRQSKVFSIFESELSALLSLGSQVTCFSSFGSALLSYAVGIWTNAIFAEELTPLGAAMAAQVAPTLVVLSGTFFALFVRAYLKYRRTIQKQLQLSAP